MDENIKIIQDIKDDFMYQIQNFNLIEINSLAEYLKNIKGNILFCGVGKSGNIAKHCCDLFKCISFPSFYVNILNLNHGDIGTLRKNDAILIFSNSGNTVELLNIMPILKNIKIKIIGICCNINAKLKQFCDLFLILPLKKEINGIIDKIPTNSIMSNLIFSNILVSILKKYISIDEYKQNHLAGNIGNYLLKVKDILIYEYPNIILENLENIYQVPIYYILLEMTQKKIGCCFFINKNKEMLGLITDGDIRRILLKNNNLSKLKLDNINTDFIFLQNKNEYMCNLNLEKNIYVPVLENKKIIGILNT